jgi:uncharacterized protein YbjT (DUF2867 family)
MAEILVTGATGNVGREVIRHLSRLTGDDRFCAAVRNPTQAQKVLGQTVPLVRFDFAKPDTFASAFAGAKKIFLMRPPSLTDIRQQVEPMLQVAQQSGVEQIVFLSVTGADKNPLLPHANIEKALTRLQIPSTFLRAGFFMQNLNTVHREDIQGGDIFLPAGKGRTSFVDVRDIAEVAAISLTQPGHENKSYTLTGSEALDYFQVAEIFTEVLGKPVTYRQPSVIKFVRQMRARHLSLSFVLVMAGIYTTTALGLASAIAPDLSQLLNRPPTTLRQYIEDYRDCWL